MKPFLSALALAVLCACAPALALGADEPFGPSEFSDYAPDLANGELVFNASGCATCHGVEGDPTNLGGGLRIETKWGVLFAPNITAHETRGIGGWTNAQFLNAVMRGLKPDGGSYFGAVFPFASYSRMKPEDALDLKAYISSLPVSDARNKDAEVNLVGGAILNTWTTRLPALPAEDDPVLARGQYLVEALGHCEECHTPRKSSFGIIGNDLDEDRAFEGFTGLLGDTAPAITPSKLIDAGPEAFIHGTMADGKKLNGNVLTAVSMLRISERTAYLSVADRAAIYAFLTGSKVDPAIVAAIEKQEAPVVVPEQPAFDIATIDTQSPELDAEVGAFCAASATPAAAPTPAVGSASQTLAMLITAADDAIEASCRNCHGPGRTDANAFLTGDIADIAANTSAVTPGNPKDSLLYQSIVAGRMPKGSSMSRADIDAIGNWIEALGAEPPASNTNELVVAPRKRSPLFAGDARSRMLDAANRDIFAIGDSDRRYVRYFDMSTIRLPAVDCDLPEDKRNPALYLYAALNKFINSVSRAPLLKMVTPVPGSNAGIARIDIRDYGWTEEDWEALTTAKFTSGARQADFSPEDWKKLALVYPFAIDPDSDSTLASLALNTGTQVPILRADWFLRFGAEEPYYDLLLRLPSQIKTLEDRFGIDVAESIRNGDVVRAGFTKGASGVSDHNRMIERHQRANGAYYWKSYDFRGDGEDQSIEVHPDGPNDIGDLLSATEPFAHDGGEMIFTLPNGLQGYYLSTNTGDRIAKGPTDIVSFRKNPMGQGVDIVNARSCFACHENGIVRKSDQMREIIEASNYSIRQSEALLKMYVAQEELTSWYDADEAVFTSALALIGSAELNPANDLVSLKVPETVGGGEIFTFVSNGYLDSLGIDEVAREFGLEPDDLIGQLRKMGSDVNARTVQIGLDWANKLEKGHRIQRVVFDQEWSYVLSGVTVRYALNVVEPSAPEPEPSPDDGLNHDQNSNLNGSDSHPPEPQQKNEPEQADKPRVSIRVLSEIMQTDSAFEIRAEMPNQCSPFMMDITPARKLIPLPVDVFTVGAADDPGTKRLEVLKDNNVGFAIEPTDERGVHRLGFYCIPFGADGAADQAKILNAVFAALAKGQLAGTVSAGGYGTVEFAFDAYTVK